MKKKAVASKTPQAVTQPEKTQPAPATGPKPSFLLCAEWRGHNGIGQNLLLDDSPGGMHLPGVMCIEEGRVDRYGEPIGEWVEPRRVSFSEAFHWWLERRLLHEKTGDFGEFDDGMEELLTSAGRILVESETDYWKKEFKRREKDAKEFEAEKLKRQEAAAKGGAK